MRNSLLIVAVISLFSGCNREPGHARYIPKDAVAVAGVNLKSLSKKIAWNVITGSKLFKEIQKRLPEKNAKDAMAGIEKAGIDALNTFYVYIKADTRFKGGNRITGLVPLSDAAEWESFVKRTFPQAQIKLHGERKEASLGRDMYVGWDKHLLIVINVSSAKYNEGDENGPKVNISSAMDIADMSAEMDNAFGVTQGNSVISNSHFMALEEEAHDVSFWLNYDQLMTQYSTDMAGKMGVSLSNTLWKDAALTTGFDFKKGKITGTMHYYLSGDFKDVGIEFGAKNVDNDLLERLPNQNMGMLTAFHISPKGVKMMLDKAGLLGLVNVSLASADMNLDDILEAFTGDMAIIINDFSLKTETVTDSFMGQTVVHKNQKPGLSMSFVIKINKKEQFQKLLKFTELAKDNGLQQIPGGYVMPLGEKDSAYLLLNDQYAVISNKYAYANGFLAGSFKNTKMAEPALSYVTGHPFAFYMDIQQIFKNIDPAISNSPQDSVTFAETKKLLSNVAANGGEYKNNSFEYHLDINFTNTEENSIIQLLDYGIKLNEAGKNTESPPTAMVGAYK